MPPTTEVMIDQYLEGDDLPTKFWSEHDKQTLKAIFKVMACALISLLVVGSVAFSWYHTQTDTVVLISTSAANAEHPNLVITDHGTFQLTGLNLLLHDGKFEYSANSMFRDIEQAAPGSHLRLEYFGWELGMFNRHIIYSNLVSPPA